MAEQAIAYHSPRRAERARFARSDFIMTDVMERPDVIARMRKWLDRAGGAEGYQKAVAWHVRARDGDVQEAKRVAVERARDQALRHVEIVELLQIQRYRKLAVVAAKLGIILPPNFDRPAPTADLAALADKARALIQTNDPDAVRQGLGEIADALDAIVRDWDPLAMFRERQAP